MGKVQGGVMVSEYVLPLQTVWIQISWPPINLDLHCLPLSVNLYQ